MTPTFPSDLPKPTTYSLGPSAQVIASDDGSVGPRDFRKISRVPGAFVNLEWQFTPAQYASFVAFWKTDLLNGHRWFLVDVYSAAGLKQHLVRFVRHYEHALIGHTYRRVTGEVEIRDRRIRSEISDLYLTSTLYPLLTSDETTCSLTIVSAYMSPPVEVIDELDVDATIITATMQSLVKFGYDTNELDVDATILAATMQTVLKDGDAGIDEVQLSLRILQATMAALLIQYENYAPESLDVQLSIVSASMS